MGIGTCGKGSDTLLVNVSNTSSTIALTVLELMLLCIGRHKGVGLNTCGEGGDLTFLQSIEHLHFCPSRSQRHCISYAVFVCIQNIHVHCGAVE